MELFETCGILYIGGVKENEKSLNSVGVKEREKRGLERLFRELTIKTSYYNLVLELSIKN